MIVIDGIKIIGAVFVIIYVVAVIRGGADGEREDE